MLSGAIITTVGRVGLVGGNVATAFAETNLQWAQLACAVTGHAAFNVCACSASMSPTCTRTQGPAREYSQQITYLEHKDCIAYIFGV